VHKGHFHIPVGMVVTPPTGEGGKEAGYMPTSFTYVTEKHSFLVKGTLTHLALRITRGGAGKGGNEGWYGPGRD